MRISIYIRTTGANKLYKSILFACLQEPDDQDLQELKRVMEVNLKRNGITQERIQAIQDTVKLLYDSQILRKKLNPGL